MPDRVAALAAAKWTEARDAERAQVDALRAAAADERHQAEADESLRARYARWRVDPAAFATEALEWPDGQGLNRYQRRALRRLAENKRLAFRSLHGVGKTAVAAVAVLWFAVTREYACDDWKVVTTASVWRQLEKFLWPEIHKWVRRIRWDIIGMEPWRKGRELLDMEIKLVHGQAFAAASDDAAKIEGAHADQLLYVFDESKAIPPATFDAAEGAFAGAGSDTASDAYALAGSTPGEPSGRFYDICRHAAGTEDWDTQHVTLAEAVAEGRVSAEWAEARARQWGVDSAVYRNRVLGEFATDDANTVIPLAWVEAANERWATMDRPDRWAEIGFDVATTGADRSELVRMAGDYVDGPIGLPPGDSRSVAAAALPHVGLTHDGPMVVIDTSGVGAGVYHVLHAERELRHRLAAFTASDRTDWRDVSGELTFANLRAAGWWHLRELLDPSLGATLALPPDDRMTGDLTAPHWRVQRNGAIVIESKDEIRSRIGRSTDVGDALVMGAWGRILRAQNAIRPAVRRATGDGASLTADLLTASL